MRRDNLSATANTTRDSTRASRRAQPAQTVMAGFPRIGPAAYRPYHRRKRGRPRGTGSFHVLSFLLSRNLDAEESRLDLSRRKAVKKSTCPPRCRAAHRTHPGIALRNQCQTGREFSHQKGQTSIRQRKYLLDEASGSSLGSRGIAPPCPRFWLDLGRRVCHHRARRQSERRLGHADPRAARSWPLSVDVGRIVAASMEAHASTEVCRTGWARS